MKEQFAILPELPIVGILKLSTYDGLTLANVAVETEKSPTEMSPFFQRCFFQFQQFLTGKSQAIDLPLDDSRLTPFQLKVLKEMEKVPFGQTATYKDLGIAMNSRAYQAIGTACGGNPFLLIYPCHRIVGLKGPGGFAHGLKMKRELLKLEQGF